MKNIFIFPLRIYIEDTDYGQVVYHANYLKFFERARSEWAEQAGMGIVAQQELRVCFPVRYAHVDFIKPAKVGQQCEVVSRIKEARKASLIYDQYLRLSATPDTILCKAEIKIACVDQHFQPRRLPESFMNFITENKRDD